MTYGLHLYFDISYLKRPHKKATQLLLYRLSTNATGVHDKKPQDIKTHPFYSYILKHMVVTKCICYLAWYPCYTCT